MPIKSTNTSIAIPKKVIYINWDEQEVLTAEEFNNSIQERIDELVEDTHCFGDFVTNEYDFADIGRALMDADFREEVLERYKEWCYNNVTEDMEGIERFEI